MKLTVWAGVLSLMFAGGLGAQGLDDWVAARSDKKVAELTVGDLKSLADVQSVQRQEFRYVHGAGIASFLVPGLGQFKTGDPLAGTLNLVGHVALVGGTFYGAWSLLPEDLKGNLSREDRSTLTRNYWHNDPAKLLPATGVLVGGLTLSVVHRFWAASDARSRAEANLESDKVVFEPEVTGNFFGFRARM